MDVIPRETAIPQGLGFMARDQVRTRKHREPPPRFSLPASARDLPV
jgi:hypothetical protein